MSTKDMAFLLAMALYANVSHAQTASEPKVAIGLSGGWGQFDGGDLRGSWQGSAALARDSAAASRYTFNEGKAYNRNGRELGGELRFKVTPKLAVLISGEAARTRFRGAYTATTSSGFSAFSGSVTDEVNSTAFGLSLQRRLWASKSQKAELHLSAGPTLISVNGSRATSNGGMEFERSGALGGRAELEFRRELAPRFKVIGRVGYALSKVTDLEGTSASFSSALPTSLSAYEYRSSSTSSTWYQGLTLNTLSSTSSTVRNVRDGAIDLSGLRVKVGLQIEF